MAQAHDRYGKQVMKMAAGWAFSEGGHVVEIDYGVGKPARIDGVGGDEIAVEVESRVAKQVRGAVLDLVMHRYPKKLLVLIPAHMASTTAEQCRFILRQFVASNAFGVVELVGTGDAPNLSADAQKVRSALEQLGYNVAD